MRKEVIIAILVGLSLGLVIVYGVKTAQQSLTNRPTTKNAVGQLSKSDTSDVSTNHTLLITSPEPDEIVSESELAVIGTTTPFSMVSVISQDHQNATVADDTGAFNTTIALKGGLSEIIVTSFNPQGDEATATFTVVYTTADLTATSSAKIEKEE